MRKLVWGVATVVLITGGLVLTLSRRADAGGQAIASLAGLSGEDTGLPVAQDRSVVTRRLYEGPELVTGDTDISPDGRYLTQGDPETGDLAVFDLLTGQFRRVTDLVSWGEVGAYAEMSVYSPDGKEIAYTWCCVGGGYQVRVIGVDGSNPRVVLSHDPQVWTWPGLRDWSPDGEHLLLDLNLGWESQELTLASVHDGSLRVLYDCAQGQGCGSATFSPDGRYIAFERRSRPRSPEDVEPDDDILLIPVLGGEVTPLLRGPADDELLGWEPEGRGILFKSDRELTEGVWRLPVIDGRPAGEPELIKGDLWRLNRIGVAEGRLYYGLVTEWPRLYTVGVDLEGGRILSPPTPVEEIAEGEPSCWAWSPDGRQLAYLRSGSAGVEELVIRSLPGGPARIIPLPPVRWIQWIWWGPTSRSLVFAAVGGSLESPGWRGFFKFDLQTGAYAPIEASEGITWPATLTGDLEVAYYDPGGIRFQEQADRPDALWARNLETGEEREVARLSSRNPNWGLPILSPDERWVARFNLPVDGPEVRAVEIISTESGELRELHRSGFAPRHPTQCGAISWSPDGEFLVYGVANPLSEGCTLQRLPVGGGDPTPIGDLPWFTTLGPPLNPLGTHLVFRHGEWRGEIWVLEYGRESGGEQ